MSIVLLVLLCFICLVSGQISVEVSTQDASCSGKGSITIMANGGKAPYSYEIIDNICGLNNKPLQNNNIFTGLTSCTYTVKAIDADGKSVTKQAIVGGNYIGPTASIDVSGCSFIINSKNGSAPIKYAISEDGGKTYNAATDQNIYANLKEGTYFLKIEDACNSVYITSATIDLDTLEYFFTRARGFNIIYDSIFPSNIRGGKGPFQFYIVNGTDTLRSSNNHFALKDIVKTCSTQVYIISGCGVYINRFEYTDTEISCLDYSGGNVEFKVNVGVPPFNSFNYVMNTSTSFPGLKISNLNKNDLYYSFSVKDACGDFSSSNDKMYRNRPELTFTSHSDCTEFNSTTLTIAQNSLIISPFDVECTTCLPATKFSRITSSINIPDLNNGKKTIVISDSCGTRWTCNSEYIIPVTESCDSIVLNLVNAFTCDNRPAGKSASGDTMKASMFYLRKADRTLIDSNQNGVFKNMINGQYIVQGSSGSCGLIEGNYIRNITQQPAKYRIGANQFNNNCNLLYTLNIDYDYYPYALTDLRGKLYTPSSNVTPQFGVYYNDLLPGNYLIKSLKNCWQDTIRLPEIKSKINLEDLTVCPVGGSVTISGGKNFGQWKSIYAAQGLDLYYFNNSADWYDFSKSSKFNYDTARHTYFNIEPGKTYTIYLHSFASINYLEIDNTCIMDSVSFTVPKYTPPSLISDLTLKCDQSNSILSQLKIKNGTQPYSIQEINCSDQSLIGNATATSDTIVVISNLSLANHCFKVTDVCQNAVSAESNIGDFNATIQSIKNCDSTTTFYFSTINGATYKWTNKTNTLLGTTPSIKITDPLPGDEIRLMIDYKGCAINKSIIINNAFQKLQVKIGPSKIIKLCATGFVKLTSTILGGIGPYTYRWSTGSQDSTIVVNTEGKYILEVNSAIGCVTIDTVDVIIGLPITLVTSIKKVLCYGDSTGSIQTILSGGIKPYTYQWSDGSSRDSISHKPAGNYVFTITDDAGCNLTQMIAIDQNSELRGQTNITAASCEVSKDGKAELITQGGIGPYTYAWSDGTSSKDLINTNPGNYTVIITDALRCSKSIIVQIPKKPVIITMRIDTICAGATIIIGNSVHSVSGNYRDTIKNRLGCDSLIQTSLVVRVPLQFTMISKNPLCADQLNGEISISNINSRGPYQFQINGTNYSGLSTNKLPSGNYVVKLTDGFQCFLEKGTSLTNPPRITLEVGKDTTIQFGDSLSLKVLTNAFNQDIKKISWTGNPGYTCDQCTMQAILKPKYDIDYKVELETVQGCKVQDLFTVKVNSDFRVFAPNALRLSEGRLSANAAFTLYGPSYIEVIDYIRIFNRLGALLFETKNIPPNDLQYGWDGTYKGQKADPGVYIYIASVLFSDGSRRILKGDITITN
jgi:SprB repeat/CHU_C Type IX secretion signal domain